MNTGKKSLGMLLLFCWTLARFSPEEPQRLALLLFSTALLALCIFSYRRSSETAEILKAGIVEAFRELDGEDFHVDLGRFGRHTRFFVALLSAAGLLYWFGIRTYVSLVLGLSGAAVVFCEFVLNFEVLGYLCSSPSACYDDRGTKTVVTLYKTLSALHIGMVTAAIFMLLSR